MSKDSMLFEKNDLTFSNKYYRLMDLLIKNKSVSRLECLIFFSIFYVQVISGFFSYHLKFLNLTFNSDTILYYLDMIFRVKDLFKDSYGGFQSIIIILLIFIIGMTSFFIHLSLKMTKTTSYSFKELLLNFLIKIFLYVLFIPILDLCFANFCFQDINPNFADVKCSGGSAFTLLISIILLISSIFLALFFQIFYSDSFFIANSFYAKVCYPYEIYMTVNNIVYSLILSQSGTIGNEIFMYYNLIISVVFFKIYYEKYLFYDSVVNKLVGVYHSLYAWTSIFFVIFYFFPVIDKGIVYIIGSVILIYLYLNLKFKIDYDIILNLPFHKIDNSFYLLYYLKTIVDSINNIKNNPSQRAKLIGIIELHAIECPNPECPTKNKSQKLYVPANNEWSNRDKPEINDSVYLLNLPVFIFNIYSVEENCKPDILINLADYYLSVMKNNCQAMILYKRLKEMKLNLYEKFSLSRLEFLISKTFVDRLKPSSEICANIEDLNVSLFFKYYNLSHIFFEEINNDINLTLDFWKSFKVHNETNRPLDFNKIFNMVDKIRMSKIKIEKLWSELFNTNSSVNDVLELYYNYVEQINDDDMLKRELDQIRNKTATSAEQINMNYYSHLFSKNTGIVIANGDKGKEGQIEKVNDEIEGIFLYKPDELKGLNVMLLMPKMFQGPHQALMERYATLGEKRLMDKNFKAFAKDKENMLIHAGLVLRQFPLLTDSILYCALAIKGTIEDAMYLDRQFNIQGMCRKLQQRFEIDSKNIFCLVDFPFYAMCKDFIDFYANYVLPKKSNINSNIAMIMDGEKKTEFQLIEDNLDNFNDALELEFTAKVPQFFFNYIKVMNTKNIKIEVTLKSDSKDDEASQDVSTGDYDEDDALVDKDGTPTDKSKDINLNKINEEDREFIMNVSHMRTLFNSKKFDELSEYIDKLNSQHPTTKEHNFIFNFIVHKYGRGDKGFIIRCIDNKNDEDNDSQVSDNGSLKEDRSNGRSKMCKEVKIDSIQELIQITHDEKQTIIKNSTDYNTLSMTNKDFTKTTNVLKREISQYSKIFGAKPEDSSPDAETASQNAGEGFNENLSKKQRIEEIRSNIMRDVSSFSALKWIRVIFLVMIILTGIFAGCYLIIYTTMFNNINNLSALNINYFQVTILFSNIVSSMISMRSVFEMKLKNDDIKYDSYISDINAYFEQLREFSEKWYGNILSRMGHIEKSMSIYYNSDSKQLWGNNKITYPANKQINTDVESFPLGISQCLSDQNKLLKSSIYSAKVNSTVYNSEDINRIRYSGYISVENAINNIIPSQINILNKITSDFFTFNYDNISYVVIIIIVYGIIMILLSVIYLVLLSITNKNLQEGFEKSAQMKLDKIDETIKKIENFNEKCLSKFRIKETQSTESKDFSNSANFINAPNTNLSHDKSKNLSNNGKKFNNLNILSFSYIQPLFLIAIIIGILIPLYSVSSSMISESNQILSIQTFIFGKLVYASHSTVNIKCVISECQIDKPIDYKIDQNFLKSFQVENIVRDLINFPGLYDFYNNKFLINACDVLYNSTNPYYKECMDDVIIKSANNTDSLLKLLEETVEILEKDRSMKQNKNIISNGKSVMFKNKYLYETEFFNRLESVFYKYITPISYEFENVVNNSLQSYLDSRRILIIIMIIVFLIVIFLFAIYIILIFIGKLIHLLSVSRCILKIIPTIVIIGTNELHSWLESKY